MIKLALKSTLATLGGLTTSTIVFSFLGYLDTDLGAVYTGLGTVYTNLGAVTTDLGAVFSSTISVSSFTVVNSGSGYGCSSMKDPLY